VRILIRAIPGVSLRSTPGYLLASFQDARSAECYSTENSEEPRWKNARRDLRHGKEGRVLKETASVQAKPDERRKIERYE